MNKNFKNRLALLMAVIVALSAFAFVGCANDAANTDTEKNTTTTTVADNTKDDGASAPTEEPATSVTTPEKVDYTLAKVYKPYKAFKDGKEVSLETVFGHGYAQYGDELVFNPDGTFSAYIGVTAGADASTGTYSLTLNSNNTPEVELHYNNDKVENAVIVTLGINNNAVELQMIKYDYYILFKDVNN